MSIPLPPKEPDFSRGPRRQRPSRAMRRLVIWYRRNAAVTSLVDTATTAATAHHLQSVAPAHGSKR